MHYLDGDDLDLRLSWSEGWGDSCSRGDKIMAIIRSCPAESFVLSRASLTPIILTPTATMSALRLIWVIPMEHTGHLIITRQ